MSSALVSTVDLECARAGERCRRLSECDEAPPARSGERDREPDDRFIL
jgi:hypothetical protein